MTDDPSSGEPYLRVEDVAERLGLPLSVLMGRVQAGDIPSRRQEDGAGVSYWLRLGDLGIEPADDGRERDGADDGGAELVGDAIQASFNPGEPSRLADDAPWSLDGGLPSQWPGMEPSPSGAGPVPAAATTVPEPGGAPDWLRQPVEPPAAAETQPVASAAAAALPAVADHDVASRLPVPQPAPRLDLFEPSTPRGDLATMSLDARELVAGLLDRWERTLEQRIYTEQRQRFESELAARQNAVKQLQMELHTARAEHAAAQADKDRILAEKERELADRERDIADARRQSIEPAGKRRRWFRRADD